MSPPLDDYRLDFLALRQFEAEHSPVIGRHKELLDNLAESEAALKEFARTNGPEDDDTFTVTVQHKIKRWYDADVLLAKAPWVANVPGIVSLDTKKLEGLIKAHAIPADLVAEAIRTEDMTPAVSIKIRVPEVK